MKTKYFGTATITTTITTTTLLKPLWIKLEKTRRYLTAFTSASLSVKGNKLFYTEQTN